MAVFLIADDFNTSVIHTKALNFYSKISSELTMPNIYYTSLYNSFSGCGHFLVGDHKLRGLSKVNAH